MTVGFHTKRRGAGQAREVWTLDTTLERRVSTTFTLRDYYDKVLPGKSEIETFTGHRWNVPQGPDLDAELSGEANRVYRNLPGYEYLVYLRHHGYPSPLLDWTESPYIAAFFALADAACKSPAVYCYVERPHGVKHGMVGQPEIWLRGPYVTSHRRHFAQRAWYTIAAHWDYTKQQHVLCPHESVFSREDERQDVAVKLVLSDAAVAQGRKRLADYNINHYTLFQTEDSLVKTIEQRSFETR